MKWGVMRLAPWWLSVAAIKDWSFNCQDNNGKALKFESVISSDLCGCGDVNDPGRPTALPVHFSSFAHGARFFDLLHCNLCFIVLLLSAHLEDPMGKGQRPY